MPTYSIDEHKFIERVAARLYTFRPQEIIAELLQNSQRAGATQVRFSLPSPTTCVYEDNGHGLEGGISALCQLLVLAESRFRDPNVEANQRPMGVGFFSALVNERITRLVIESNQLSLEIDTGRWMHDEDYWASWEERVVVHDEVTIPGFRLVIEGSEDLLTHIRQCLTRGNSIYDLCDADSFRARYNPVGGYSELFDVFLDGESVSVSLPWDVTLPRPDISLEYLGNTLRIALFPTQQPRYSGLMTNWFGQAIPDYNGWNGLRVYLAVRQGHPVSPMAPTRTALIQDETLHRLRAFIEDQIFSWVCTQENPPAMYVKRLFQLYPERAMRECPFAVIQAWKPLPEDYDFTSFAAYHEDEFETLDNESDERGAEMVIPKSTLNSYLFLDEHVTCLLPKSHPAQPYSVRTQGRDDPTGGNERSAVVFEVGLTSLLAATGIVAHSAVAGVSKEHLHRFWWQPGPMVDEYHTTDLGMFTIQQGTDGSRVPEDEAWAPLTHEAFVANETDSYSITAINWVIALSARDRMIRFLERRGHAAFEPDEDEEERSEEAYTDSVHALLCQYLPDTLNRDTLLVALPTAVQPLLPSAYKSRQASFTLLPEGGYPTSIRLTFPDGFTKDIRLY